MPAAGPTGKMEPSISTFNPIFVKGVKGQGARLNYFDNLYGQGYLERSIHFLNYPAPFISGSQGSFVINFNHNVGDYFWWDAILDIASGFDADHSNGMLKKYSRLQLFLFPPDSNSGQKKELDAYRRGQLMCIAEMPEGNIDISGPFVNSKQWYQLVLTWEKRVLSMYVDGKLVGSKKLPADLEIELAPRVYIGANMHGSCQFQGSIDEVMIFNRALDSNEIKEMYSGKDCSTVDGKTFYMPCENNLNAEITRQSKQNYQNEHMVFFADIGEWFYRPVGPLKMQLSIPSGKSQQYDCSVRVFEAFTGRNIYQKQCRVQASGTLKTYGFDTNLKDCGVFAVEVNVKDLKGNTVFSRRKDFGVTVKAPSPRMLSDSYPICGHNGLHMHYRHGHGPSIGYKWIRLWDTSNHWADLNPAPGQYYWDFLDRLVEQAESDGQKILLCIFGPPQWASDAPDHKERVRRMMLYGGEILPFAELHSTKLVFSAAPKNTEVFETFLRALFERYKGRIEGYELWNEPGSIFFGTPKQYVELLKVMRKVQKEVDPSAVVVAGVGCPGYIDWDRTLIENGIGPYMQILSVHDYNYTNPIDWYKRNEIAIAKKEMSEASGKNIPVWGTETGFMIETRHNGQMPLSMEEFVKKHGKEYFDGITITVQEDLSAKWEMQSVFTELLGGLDKYFFHGSGFIGAPNNKGVAFAALTHVLNNYKSIHRFETGIPDSIGALIELTNGKHNAVLFANNDTDILLSGSKAVTVLDYLGNSSVVEPIDGMLRIRIGAAPVYLLDVPSNLSAIKNITMEWPDKLIPGKTAAGKLTVSNPFSREETFSLKLEAPKGWDVEVPGKLELSASKSMTIPVKIMVPENTERGDYIFAVNLSGPHGLQMTLRDKLHSDGNLIELPEIKKSINLLGDGLSTVPNLLTAKLASLDRIAIGKPNPMFPDAKEGWKGAHDLNFVVRAGWRPDGIYLEIDVTDNSIVTIPKTEKQLFFEYDNIELFVDFRQRQNFSANREGSEQIFIVPSLTPKFSFCRINYPNEGKNVSAFFFGRKTSYGYQLRGKITPNNIGLIKLEKGSEFGLDIAIDDRDEGNSKRKSQIVWIGSDKNYENCNLWGRFKLIDIPNSKK